MKLFRKLSKEEYDEYYLESAKMVYNIGRRLFGNQEDEILDFCQDVYLKGRDKFHKFEGRSEFSTWLYRLAMNLGLNKLRAQKRLKINSGDISEDYEEPVASVSHGETKDGLAELIDKEITETVQQELANLRDEYRIPLILLYYEKMSIAEMSEKLKAKEGTIKSWIYRGKQELRNRLEQKGVS